MNSTKFAGILLLLEAQNSLDPKMTQRLDLPYLCFIRTGFRFVVPKCYLSHDSTNKISYMILLYRKQVNKILEI